ncbi:MAG TPA: hypothetical protein VIL16_25600 [Trebonia sp.]
MTRRDLSILSPARKEMEAHAAHVGLITRTPEESPLTNRWEADWWNGPVRKVREYADEDELIADMRRTFGPPEGDPDEP